MNIAYTALKAITEYPLLKHPIAYVSETRERLGILSETINLVSVSMLSINQPLNLLVLFPISISSTCNSFIGLTFKLSVKLEIPEHDIINILSRFNNYDRIHTIEKYDSPLIITQKITQLS